MSHEIIQQPYLVFILSHERAGTHLLQDILTGDSRFESFDEVCNYTSAPDSTIKWYNFLKRRLVLDPDALQPSGEKRADLVKRYIAFLDRSRSEGKFALVDIKYGHVHNFDDQWFDLHYMPMFLSILKEMRARIIHLYRVDTIAAVCSNMLADRTGIYHALQENSISTQIRIDPKDVVFQAQILSYTQCAYKYHLASFAHVELVYEEDLSSGMLSDRGLAEIKANLGVNLTNRTAPRLKKVSPGLPEYVLNFEELKQTMSKLGYRTVREILRL